MSFVEHVAQQEVAVTRCRVKLVPGFSIIAIICENAALPIETIRPVVFFGCERENREPRALFGTEIAEAALIADTNKMGQRLIRRVTVAPALVGGIDQKVGCLKREFTACVHV